MALLLPTHLDCHLEFAVELVEDAKRASFDYLPADMWVNHLLVTVRLVRAHRVSPLEDRGAVLAEINLEEVLDLQTEFLANCLTHCQE